MNRGHLKKQIVTQHRHSLADHHPLNGVTGIVPRAALYRGTKVNIHIGIVIGGTAAGKGQHPGAGVNIVFNIIAAAAAGSRRCRKGKRRAATQHGAQHDDA